MTRPGGSGEGIDWRGGFAAAIFFTLYVIQNMFLVTLFRPPPAVATVTAKELKRRCPDVRLGTAIPCNPV
jgi:hypothetical protein